VVVVVAQEEGLLLVVVEVAEQVDLELELRCPLLLELNIRLQLELVVLAALLVGQTQEPLEEILFFPALHLMVEDLAVTEITILGQEEVEGLEVVVAGMLEQQALVTHHQLLHHKEIMGLHQM
jgi:hypothetical protein